VFDGRSLVTWSVRSCTMLAICPRAGYAVVSIAAGRLPSMVACRRLRCIPDRALHVVLSRLQSGLVDHSCCCALTHCDDYRIFYPRRVLGLDRALLAARSRGLDLLFTVLFAHAIRGLGSLFTRALRAVCGGLADPLWSMWSCSSFSW